LSVSASTLMSAAVQSLDTGVASVVGDGDGEDGVEVGLGEAAGEGVVVADDGAGVASELVGAAAHGGAATSHTTRPITASTSSTATRRRRR